MKRDIKELLKSMSLEEKASLCSGLNFWSTKAIDRLSIPSIMMTDGPHGLRKQDGESDHIGLNKSVPATCFPTASALASSWNTELLERVGIALGEECQAENVSILLGPGLNIKRSPLCGRNFEYYSEDPVLSGELATAWVKGVQSQGVGTSMKHFAVNNQEFERMTISAEVDERTLREIYLAGFERVITKAKPWTVMSAYNRINGEYCSESKYLLTDILRNEWGFDGFVVSDWGAVDLRVEALMAGLELDMPSNNGVSDEKIIQAVRDGRLDEGILDTAVERLLGIVFKAVDNQKKNATYDKEKHQELAKEAASECVVLLKNQDNILPLNKGSIKRLGIIGGFAKNSRYQGGGSSHVNATKLENAYDGIIKLVGNDVVKYAQGYSLIADTVEVELLKEAADIASTSDIVVLFVGLPESYESEGFDRTHIDIPESHRLLIEEVLKVQENVIVVLSNGSVIAMDTWNYKVKAILEGWLTGQASGKAIADILFGITNPSGKLPETFPRKLSDNPSYLNFPGKKGKIKYQEGIFVGYRYYDIKKVDVLYPFGFGLSYTTFEYSDMRLSHNEMTDVDTLEVRLKVKNTGKCFGKEIVQLYVKDVECSDIRPEKELKGFIKVALNPGEEKEVTFLLGRRDFAFFDSEEMNWLVETGDFEILVGKSSNDICLKDCVHIIAPVKIETKKFDRNSTISELLVHPVGAELIGQIVSQFSQSFSSEESDDGIAVMMQAMMGSIPLRSLMTFSQGAFTEEMMQGILEAINKA